MNTLAVFRSFLRSTAVQRTSVGRLNSRIAVINLERCFHCSAINNSDKSPVSRAASFS